MFRPDDPLAPPAPVFDAPWHAQVLAMADSLVHAGHVSADDWAQALGQQLADAEASGAPDTPDTYFTAALTALERLSESHAGIAEADRHARKEAWKAAYRRTPHGQPVKLSASGDMD